jgi:hypothetical protein
METGTVVKVRRTETDTVAGARVEIVDGGDLRARYERLVSQVLRMGAWLTTPQAQLMPEEQWEELFARYQEQLEGLRRLGDELRPVSLRDRNEPLTGDALTCEVIELFAA